MSQRVGYKNLSRDVEELAHVAMRPKVLVSEPLVPRGVERPDRAHHDQRVVPAARVAVREPRLYAVLGASDLDVVGPRLGPELNGGGLG